MSDLVFSTTAAVAAGTKMSKHFYSGEFYLLLNEHPSYYVDSCLGSTVDPGCIFDFTQE
jgi:hypothetical protein